MGEPTKRWCWYTEGSSFVDVFASRREAVHAALNDETPGALVGTVVASSDAIARLVSADYIADQVGDEMSTDEGVRTLPGAQAALEEWARTYLEHGYSHVCLDGSDITDDEIAEWEQSRAASRFASEGEDVSEWLAWLDRIGGGS